jgi:hypothetical protein
VWPQRRGGNWTWYDIYPGLLLVVGFLALMLLVVLSMFGVL